MGRLALIILLLAIPIAAQGPAAIKINGQPAEQLKVIAEEQEKLVREFNRLEGLKTTWKYRACLENKLDAEKCDAHEIALTKDGYVLQPKAVAKTDKE